MVKLHLLRLNLLNNFIIKGVGALKISRPLSILLCFIFFISSFTVTVYGADEKNLIDSNLSNWTVLHPDNCSVIPASTSLYLVRIYGVQKPPAIPEGPSPIWYLGGAFDLTDSNITVGNKYTLSFNFPDPDRYVSSSTGSNSFIGDNSGTLIVGLCSYLSDDTLEPIEGCYFTINKNNFNSVKDTDIQLSFEMPSGVVNPCICFYYTNFGGTNTVCFYLKDFKLIDESKAEEDNFFSRLFEWFEVKFKVIGDSFSDLGAKLGELKNSFTESISNLGNSIKGFFEDLGTKFNTAISNLGNSIGGFFTKLGNLILYASWSEVPPENPFLLKESPMSSLSERLDNISIAFDSAGESFENVIDSITGPVYLLDEFTKEFGWILGILVFTLLVIVISRFIGL